MKNLTIIWMIVVILFLKCHLSQGQIQDYPTLGINLYESKQESFYQRIPQPIKVMTFCLVTTAFDAISDAYIAQNKNRVLAHTLDATNILMLLSSKWICGLEKGDWLAFVSVNVGFRAGVYDIIHHTRRGLPWNYRSDASFWDKFLSEVNPPPGTELFGRVIVVSISVTITFNFLND